jgi:hypothetical protein
MISTRAVFDIETGALLERDRIEYDGPIAECSFINRLPLIVPGQAQPTMNDSLFLRQAIVLSGTSETTVNLPSTGSFTTSISKGKIRVKFTAPTASGVSPAVSYVYFVLTDGINFVEVGKHTTEVLAIGANPAVASMPQQVDRVIEFEVDINATSLVVEYLLTGTSPIILMDLELSGTT